MSQSRRLKPTMELGDSLKSSPFYSLLMSLIATWNSHNQHPLQYERRNKKQNLVLSFSFVASPSMLPLQDCASSLSISLAGFIKATVFPCYNECLKILCESWVLARIYLVLTVNCRRL